MKKYYCRKIFEDIQINGDISKKVWQTAGEVSLVETSSADEPRQKTAVKALWNDTYLYFAFKCEDTYINAALTGYNDLIYNEEVVEVFIDDDNDGKTYTEIEVNPLNAVLHYHILNNLKGKFTGFARVDKIVDSAVYRDDSQNIWSVEIRIPLSEFVTARNNPPEPVDEWGINFYRIDRPEDGNDEYSAFSPTGVINFHRPDKFGKLVFLD
jgi:hypothetical protein